MQILVCKSEGYLGILQIRREKGYNSNEKMVERVAGMVRVLKGKWRTQLWDVELSPMLRTGTS